MNQSMSIHRITNIKSFTKQLLGVGFLFTEFNTLIYDPFQMLILGRLYIKLKHAGNCGKHFRLRCAFLRFEKKILLIKMVCKSKFKPNKRFDSKQFKRWLRLKKFLFLNELTLITEYLIFLHDFQHNFFHLFWIKFKKRFYN